MAKINFIVKGKLNPATIHLRFKGGRKFDLSTSTELLINPLHWSKAKQKVSNKVDAPDKDFINNSLAQLKVYVIERYNMDNAKGTLINKYWLNKVVANFFSRPVNEQDNPNIYFTAFIKEFLKKAPNRYVRQKENLMSAFTIKKYQTTFNHLLEFENKVKTNYRIQDIDLKFYNKFTHYLREIKKHGNNTIGTHIKTIKTFLHDAESQGIPVNPQFKSTSFYAPTQKTKDIYLTENEIKQIFDFDFGDNPRLDNARDLFIIGLRTGLRVSDFLKLDTLHIKQDNFEVTTRKTGKKVLIPIHHQIKEILHKRGGLPRKISDQKFNLYIKEVAQKVGFTQLVDGAKRNPETNRKEQGQYPKYELVTSHICRRSFATNLYGKLPNRDIMGITGHQTESQFLKYLKTTPQEHANNLRNYWEQQEQTETPEFVPKMQVLKNID